MQKELGVSEKRACRVIGHPRSTQRYNKQTMDDEELLIKRIVELASEYGRYGYRRVTAPAAVLALAPQNQQVSLP